MYRNGQDRAEAVSGTGSLLLRPPGNIHIHSHSFIHMFCTYGYANTHAHAHICSHDYVLPHGNTHSHMCSLICLRTRICALTQMGLTFARCTPHAARSTSPHTGTHSPQCHTGRYTYSHHCIPTLSYTQFTDCSLTSMYIFSQTQRALACLHSHWYTQMRIPTEALTSLHSQLLQVEQNSHFRYSAEVKDCFLSKSYCKRLRLSPLHE